MAFHVIEDMEQADKLWAAGLLWVRSELCEWQLDATYENGKEYAPSNDDARFPENTYVYALLIEE